MAPRRSNELQFARHVSAIFVRNLHRAPITLKVSMRALLAAALLLASSQALLLPRVPQATAVRARSPSMLFDGLFGGDKAAPKRSSTNLNEILRKPEKDWTPEERKIVTNQASNWDEYKKDNQRDNTFFQTAAPKTGEQADMPDFFSAEARSGAEVPPQLLAFGGISALGIFALLVFLVFS